MQRSSRNGFGDLHPFFSSTSPIKKKQAKRATSLLCAQIFSKWYEYEQLADEKLKNSRNISVHGVIYITQTSVTLA